MNDIAEHFLETYAQGGEVEGGWLFAKALRQAQLDYSDESLQRLDQLLAAIRQRAKPSREALQSSLSGRNFCSLLAYYAMEVVRRRSQAHIVWHDRASALRVLPPGTQLPDVPRTRLIAIAPDQGSAYLPLGWVEEQVLGEGQPANARRFVREMIAELERDGPMDWWNGMYALGWLASYQMMMAADGGRLYPTLLSSRAPKSLRQFGLDAVNEADYTRALESGGHLIERNPEGAVWQVLAYDGFLNLDRGGVDAVMVILRTYGVSPLTLKIAFPYRPAQRDHAFAILDPILREANVEFQKVTLLNSAMDRGIRSVTWAFGKTWDQLRQPG